MSSTLNLGSFLLCVVREWLGRFLENYGSSKVAVVHRIKVVGGAGTALWSALSCALMAFLSWPTTEAGFF
jgi:hypothetical protein